jgi:hypothetical protein
MYWRTALVLLTLWIVGFGVFRINRPLMHVVLAFAVITFLWHVRVGGGNPI